MDKKTFEELKRVGDLDVHPTAKVSQEELKSLLPKVNGLIIRSATKVTAELLKLAPQLKYVIRAGEGTDNIDKQACAAAGVKVSNTPGANSNAVAELAISLMLSVLRKTAWAHASMASGRWDKATLEVSELSEKTVGLVGFGKIAQLVAKRLAGFDVKILYYDVYPVASPFAYARQVQTLEELFQESDVVSLHIPKTEKTKNIVDKQLLGLMKKSGVLINTSRGGLIDESALCHFLEEKKILGAGLDVFATEPLEESALLRQQSNVVLTPHLGASSEEAQVRVGEIAVHQIKEFFLKKNLLNEVKA
jgi:D-3-phosphoglycerate dehydrogenase